MRKEGKRTNKSVTSYCHKMEIAFSDAEVAAILFVQYSLRRKENVGENTLIIIKKIPPQKTLL